MPAARGAASARRRACRPADAEPGGLPRGPAPRRRGGAGATAAPATRARRALARGARGWGGPRAIAVLDAPRRRRREQRGDLRRRLLGGVLEPEKCGPAPSMSAAVAVASVRRGEPARRAKNQPRRPVATASMSSPGAATRRRVLNSTARPERSAALILDVLGVDLRLTGVRCAELLRGADGVWLLDALLRPGAYRLGIAAHDADGAQHGERRRHAAGPRARHHDVAAAATCSTQTVSLMSASSPSAGARRRVGPVRSCLRPC